MARLHARFLNALLVASGFTLSATSIACDRGTPAEAAGPSVSTAAVTATTPEAHGDHNPHHGGTVYMKGEMHYEVVLSKSGRHRLYFSDAAREDLPASIASSVTLTIERPDRPVEKITGAIDEYGESWMLFGEPVDATGVSTRVAFVVYGENYWIDVPFIAANTADPE
jgi:hypothetical protein